MQQQQMKAQELASISLYLMGAYQPNDIPGKGATNRAIQLLNIILRDLAKDGVFIPINTFYEFELIGNKANYTFSDTIPADFNQPMIVDFVSCDLIINGIQNPVLPYTPEQIAGVFLNKNSPGQPGGIVLDKQAQYSQLTFYPTPQQNYTCQIRYKSITSTLQENDELLNLPDYYQKFLIYKLGKFLSHFYPANTWDQDKQDELNRIESEISAANPSVTTTQAPVELQPIGYGGYWMWGNRGGMR